MRHDYLTSSAETRREGSRKGDGRERRKNNKNIVKAGPLARQAILDRARVKSPPERECQALAIGVEATQTKLI